ncbi:MAG: M50 family metallopeptidase [Fimbriimonas sp.]
MSLGQETKETGAKSPWSFRVFSVSGIPIRIHFTFLLFLAWIAFQGNGNFMWTGLVLAIFACVLLHELGHALTARRYGVQTRDITLYPIGGVAMLDGRPTARAEFWIALAGPAVNIVIAAVLAGVLFVTEGGVPRFTFGQMASSFPAALFMANLSLAIFNMVPAFPMDGGRVLRSLLAMRMDETRATQIAATIGQGLAIAFGFYALFKGEPILMLVSFFVFLGAAQEASQSITRSFLFGHAIQDAMQRRFRTIPHGETMETAADMLLAGSQHDFPVAAGSEIVGVLTRGDIAQGLATQGPSGYVANFMRREFKTAHPNVPLELAIDMFSKEDPTPILVMEEGELVGMVTQENLSEFIMLEHARQQRRGSYA